ncbi:T9SS type A sorting domain-containing protein, partial [candidate division WOR-3 bacterium]|nr:T9SS type A sorting domain-containing protein [candidate division WOR-3 bacterium]
FAKLPDVQPTLSFYSSDPQNDNIQYRILWDTDPVFDNPEISTTALYESDEVVNFTFPSPLTDGETYWWKVQCTDPGGSGFWTSYTIKRSFTISTILPANTCSWFQTTSAQFDFNTFSGTMIQVDCVILVPSGETIVDTVFEEDFEAGSIPSGWTVINGNGDAVEWTVGTTSDIGSYSPPSYSTNYAYYSDDNAGNGEINTNEELLSLRIYIPSVADSLKFRYGWGFRRYQSGERMDVRVRLFNGGWSDWDTLATYSLSGSGTATFDLTSYLPADSVQFNWTYNDESSSSHWGYACATDNVILRYFYSLSNDEGTITGVPVIYNDLSSTYPRSHWGSVTWQKEDAEDSIGIQVEYYNETSWQLIPDGDLPGNSAGFFTPLNIDISSLNTSTYDTLRLVGLFYRKSSKAPDDPVLFAWEIGNLSELSIYLTEFSATGLKGKVKIYWRTESEIDNVCWIVEKTPDVNDEWEQIGSVDGQGTKPTPTEYLFFDENMGKDGKYYYRLISIDREGEKSIFGPVSVIVLGNIPRVYALHDIYPNPFCGRLEIRYDIPEYSSVDLRVYNSVGQVVNTLINGKVEPGYHRVVWNGKNDMGNNVGNGIYFLRMDTDDFIKTRKVILIK